jgi:hypothetical protein
LNGQTEPAGGVLAVGDADVYIVLVARESDAALQGFTARRADDVSNQEQGK